MSRPVKEETLEQVAERIMLPGVGKVAPAIWNAMVHDVLSALRNERERAAKINEAMRPTGGRMWTDEQTACFEALTAAAAAIRGRTE